MQGLAQTTALWRKGRAVPAYFMRLPCYAGTFVSLSWEAVPYLRKMYGRTGWNPYVCIWGYPKFGIAVLMMIPLIADGTLQRLTSYESHNGRRLITGILFGIALVFVFLYFHQMCVGIAGSILKWIGWNPVTVDEIMKRFLP